MSPFIRLFSDILPPCATTAAFPARLPITGSAPDGVTLEEIGQILGVSKERVRQIEVSTLVKYRRWVDRHGYRLEDLIRHL